MGLGISALGILSVTHMSTRGGSINALAVGRWCSQLARSGGGVLPSGSLDSLLARLALFGTPPALRAGTRGPSKSRSGEHHRPPAKRSRDFRRST